MLFISRDEKTGSEVTHVTRVASGRVRAIPSLPNAKPILFLHATVSCMKPTLWLCLTAVASVTSCILLCGHRKEVASAALRRSSVLALRIIYCTISPDRDLGSSKEQLKMQSIKIQGLAEVMPA